MFRTASGQHGKITLSKPFGRILIDGIKRIHEAIAKGIGVNIERRMDEVRNISPERLIAFAQADRRSEAFALYFKPDLTDLISCDLATFARLMDLAFKAVKRNLPHNGVDHILDFCREHRLALLFILRVIKQPTEGEHLTKTDAVSASVNGVGAINAPFAAART